VTLNELHTSTAHRVAALVEAMNTRPLPAQIAHGALLQQALERLVTKGGLTTPMVAQLL
jgi:hypothetical protein